MASCLVCSLHNVRLGTVGFDAVGFAGLDVGWAVGEGGRIARFEGLLLERE